MHIHSIVFPGILGGALVLAACSSHVASRDSAAAASLGLKPVASIQELMQAEIDPSADGIWDAVESVITAAGDEEHQPRTPAEWAAVRRSGINLIEATNLLQIQARRVGAHPFPAEAAGALDSEQIEQRIAGNRAVFDAFAVALRDAGVTALAAIDAKDPVALVKAGGNLDEICEGCHVTFWYPNQVIPKVAAR